MDTRMPTTLTDTDGRHVRGQRTREALLDAAMRVIAEQGVAAATQRTVATAAGASLASTTYHFGTRDELLTATMERAASHTIEQISALKQAVLESRGDLVETCLQYIDDQRAAGSYTSIVTFELTVAASREERLRVRTFALLESLRELFSPFVARPGWDLAIAQSFSGVLLTELARGPGVRTPGLEQTVTAVFDAFGVTEAAESLRIAHREAAAG
jgi:DNA-binding transcriptional regulator YbjK